MKNIIKLSFVYTIKYMLIQIPHIHLYCCVKNIFSFSYIRVWVSVYLLAYTWHILLLIPYIYVCMTFSLSLSLYVCVCLYMRICVSVTHDEQRFPIQNNVDLFLIRVVLRHNRFIFDPRCIAA